MTFPPVAFHNGLLVGGVLTLVRETRQLVTPRKRGRS